ncbi:hypothetical protein QD409_35500, partial [Rhizobium sp. BR 315]
DGPSTASSPAMPRTDIITFTKFPMETCRGNNAADGTGSLIGQPHAYKVPATQNLSAEEERGVVWTQIVREQACALAIMPNQFYQVTTATPEAE